MQVVEAFGSLLPIDRVIRGYPPGNVNWQVVGCKPIAAPGEGFTMGAVVGEGSDGFEVCP